MACVLCSVVRCVGLGLGMRQLGFGVRAELQAAVEVSVASLAAWWWLHV